MMITDMTRRQFEALPSRDWQEDIGEFRSFVILPTRFKHDSGWGIMDFVAVRAGEAVCKLSGCTDDLEIADSNSWRIDMLFKSKLLHVRSRNNLSVGCALSSLTIRDIKK
jgi:hypothetical protein